MALADSTRADLAEGITVHPATVQGVEGLAGHLISNVADGFAVVVVKDGTSMKAVPLNVEACDVLSGTLASVANVLFAAHTRVEDTLSDGEIDALARYETAAPHQVALALAEAELTHSRITSESLTVEDAAQRLGVQGSRIRQRLGDASLFGLKVKSKWRLPAWQFTSDGLVPGIETVNQALRRDCGVVTIEGFLTTPNVDLVIAGNHVTPIQWLRSGENPTIVASIASSL